MSELRLTRTALEIAGRKFFRARAIPDPVPELLQLLLHDWTTDWAIEASWSTDVVSALSGAEERRGLVDKPYRQIRTRMTGMSREESALIWSVFMRSHHQRLPVPIQPDRLRVVGAVGAGATTIPTVEDPRLYRFFPGMLAAVFRAGGIAVADQIEIVEVDSLTGSAVVVSGPLTVSHGAGSEVVPLAIGEPLLDASGQVETDRGFAVDLEVEEAVGPLGMPAWAILGDFPPLPTYRQVPIFPRALINWSEPVRSQAYRPGTRHQRGRGTVVDLIGDRPRAGFSFGASGLDRPTSVDILRLLDSRRGRLHTFWFTNPQSLWAPVSFDREAVVVATPSDGARFVDHVALLFRGGHVAIREVAGVSAVSGGVALAFREPLPLEDEARVLEDVTSAHLSRFRDDAYRETWRTDSHVSVDLQSIEVLREQRAPVHRLQSWIPQEEPGSGLTVPELFPRLRMYVEAPINLLDSLGAPVVNSAAVYQWRDERPSISRRLVAGGLGGVAHYRYNDWLVAGTYPSGVAGSDAIAFMRLDPEEAPFSNSRGMTILVAMQREQSPTYPTQWDYIVSVGSADGPGNPVHWTPTGLTLRRVTGDPDPDFQAPTGDLFFGGGFHVAAVVWRPAQSCRIYVDGVFAGETPRAPDELLAPASGTPPTALRFANSHSGSPIPNGTIFKALAIFPRALDFEELNVIGNHMAIAAGATWRRVTT
ncbi:MAG: hypothetical protein AB7I38_18600 [Dehalococcoidia bacterium]